MKKEDIIKENKKLKSKVKDLKAQEKFLFEQQKKLIKLAEEQGSELAKYKQELLRAQETIEKLKRK